MQVLDNVWALGRSSGPVCENRDRRLGVKPVCFQAAFFLFQVPNNVLFMAVDNLVYADLLR